MPKVYVGPVDGVFPSIKMGCSVPYKGTTHRDTLYFLEFYQEFTWYRSWPFKVSALLDDGIVHTYTPDLEVHMRHNRGIWECKPEALSQTPEALQQIEVGTRWSILNDYYFLLVKDIDLRTGPRLRNLKLVFRYGRLQVPQELIRKCQRFFIDQPIVTVGSLARYLSGTQSVKYTSHIYGLIFQHFLEVDMETRLTLDSLIWLKKQED